MKRIITCAVLAVAVGTAGAQTNKKALPSDKKVEINPEAHRMALRKVLKQDAPVIKMSSTAEYAAMQPADNEPLTISDPIVRTFNERSNGRSMEVDMYEMIAAPKRAHGFAHGHITFTPGGARTSGAITGSGSVSTGTSPGAVGTLGSGLNGKNPYAGIGIWPVGTGMGTLYQTSDPAKSIRTKKED